MKESQNIIVQSSNNGISRIILNEPSTYNALSLDTLKPSMQDKINGGFNKSWEKAIEINDIAHKGYKILKKSQRDP